MDERTRHHIAMGWVQPQAFDEINRQKALEFDPHQVDDPRHILNVGDSDLAANAPTSAKRRR